MHKSAIEQIQKTGNIPELIEQVAHQNTNTPLIVLPGDFKVESLEKWMPKAAHYRASFKTNSIDEFITYTKDHTTKDSVCCISESSAECIFDMGSPESPLHKMHKASLNLNYTADYDALRSSKATMSQQEASDFMEENQHCITAIHTSKTDSVDIKNALSQIRNLTIETARQIESSIGDFSESMSAMEKIEAKNADKMPRFIHYKCKPFDGFSSREFVLRVSIITSAEKPKIIFKIMAIEKAQEEIRKEFKEIIKSKFGDDGPKTYLGAIA